MKFIALPVNVGDSFLLKNENSIILVDGGMNKQHIVKLLNKESIQHIDLLVCTHYDADHINGIIGILKSNKFTFKELWLPEILGSIGYTLSKNIFKLFGYLRENKFELIEYFRKSKPDDILFEDESIKNYEVNENFEKIDITVLDEFITYFYRNLYFNPFRNLYFNPFWFYYYDNILFKMMTTLKLIAILIKKSLLSGAYIRWFKYKGYTHKYYGFNLYSENAVQTDITLYEPKKFFLSLYHLSLSNINKYSLVFLYEKNNFPNVLFSADSDLHFYSKPLILKDNSIVTAPHHGSRYNDNAYQKIKGNNLIFVRSDRSQVKRPGLGYLNQRRRYCTICRNLTSKQKVELIYNKKISNFITYSRPCVCHYII